MSIDVQQPQLTDYERAQDATEEALNMLLKQAKLMGLDVTPVMGLMYLPTQEMTEAFIQACHTILIALTPPASHFIGADAREYWQGQDVPDCVPKKSS